jgi:non-canonical poly(A) RNA polymerase PAPD5/7
LHEEIEAFVQWMVPTPAEHDLRLSVINRLRAAIKEIYPAAIVQIFGSFRTGLYLPTR